MFYRTVSTDSNCAAAGVSVDEFEVVDVHHGGASGEVVATLRCRDGEDNVAGLHILGAVVKGYLERHHVAAGGFALKHLLAVGNHVGTILIKKAALGCLWYYQLWRYR